MKIITHALWIILLIASVIKLDAQVTIGSGLSPTRAALLDLKEKQNANPTNVGETESATSGGFLLPRVKLVSTSTLQPFIPITDPEWDGGAKQKTLSLSLVGLMVYNIASDGGNLYPGIYSWNGGAWVTSQANPSKLSIATQPSLFSFYETGIAADKPMEALRFVVNSGTDINGNAIPVTYQWYQMVGNNRNARIGKALASAANKTNGSQTFAYTPNELLKGTTMEAKNAGFYRFYCVATDNYGASVQSEIVEIAVGCGAKNTMGDWLTFMCFNLGAGENIGTPSYKGISIDEQKNYHIGAFTNNYLGFSGDHEYIPHEEILWGDLFQWGRIADGHEKRSELIGGVATLKAAVPFGILSITDIESGEICTANSTQRYPHFQIKKGTEWDGRFIETTSNNGHEWNPRNTENALLLWRTGRFLPNDPCAKVKLDGSYPEWWSTAIGSDACTDPQLGWRTPEAEDFGAIFKGGTSMGAYDSATSNTWIRTAGTPANNNASIEIQPDGQTTTLLFTATGYKDPGRSQLRLQGGAGYYHTISRVGNQLQYATMSGAIYPAYISSTKGYGMALRCIKYE